MVKQPEKIYSKNSRRVQVVSTPRALRAPVKGRAEGLMALLYPLGIWHESITTERT